jgi:GT2 family glycosyltransferase
VIGLVMAAYNATDWIWTALSTVCAQTSDRWRLVVVDDGSTDGTGEFVRHMLHYPERWGEAVHRIWLMRRPHEGLAKSVNAGMSFVAQAFPDTRYVGCVAADDYLSLGYVATLSHALDSHPSAPCAYPRVHEFGARHHEWRPEDYREGVLVEKNIIPGCAIWRRSIWDAVGGFDVRFTSGLEDWHFAAKAEALGFLGPFNRALRVEGATYWHQARADSLSAAMTDEYRSWAKSEILRCFGGARVVKPASDLPLGARGPLPVGPYTEAEA